MKISILGATGSLGRHLVKHFLQNPVYELEILGRNPEKSRQLFPDCPFLAFDFSATLPVVQTDIFIHIAGETGKTSDDSYFEKNAQSLLKILPLVSAKHFIYISSSSVYPFHSAAHTESEKIVLENLSAYGKSKRYAEIIIEKHSRQFEKCTIFRPRSVYCEGDTTLIPRLRRLVFKGFCLRPNIPDITSSLTSVDNLSIAIESSFYCNYSFEIFNVADAIDYNLQKVLDMVLERLKSKNSFSIQLPFTLLNFLSKKGIFYDSFEWNQILHSNILSIEKAKEMLHYRPKINFFDQIDLVLPFPAQ